MVERPIKKSERQNVVENSGAIEPTVEVSSSTESNSNSEGRKIAAPRRKEKGERVEGAERGEKRERGDRGRGKGKSDRQEERKPVNLALLRGPRPTQPKSPVLAEPSEATTVDLESEQVAASESEDSSPEA